MHNIFCKLIKIIPLGYWKILCICISKLLVRLRRRVSMSEGLQSQLSSNNNGKMVPTRTLQNFERTTTQARTSWRNKKELGSRFNPLENICIRLCGLHGVDACVRSADPAGVVVPHMEVGGNPLRASLSTARFVAGS